MAFGSDARPAYGLHLLRALSPAAHAERAPLVLGKVAEQLRNSACELRDRLDGVDELLRGRVGLEARRARRLGEEDGVGVVFHRNSEVVTLEANFVCARSR